MDFTCSMYTHKPIAQLNWKAEPMDPEAFRHCGLSEMDAIWVSLGSLFKRAGSFLRKLNFSCETTLLLPWRQWWCQDIYSGPLSLSFSIVNPPSTWPDLQQVDTQDSVNAYRIWILRPICLSRPFILVHYVRSNNIFQKHTSKSTSGAIWMPKPTSSIHKNLFFI